MRRVGSEAFPRKASRQADSQQGRISHLQQFAPADSDCVLVRRYGRQSIHGILNELRSFTPYQMRRRPSTLQPLATYSQPFAFWLAHHPERRTLQAAAVLRWAAAILALAGIPAVALRPRFPRARWKDCRWIPCPPEMPRSRASFWPTPVKERRQRDLSAGPQAILPAPILDCMT